MSQAPNFGMTEDQIEGVDVILSSLPMPLFDGTRVHYPEGSVEVSPETWIGMHAEHLDTAKYCGLAQEVCRVYVRTPEARGPLTHLMRAMFSMNTGHDSTIDWSDHSTKGTP